MRSGAVALHALLLLAIPAAEASAKSRPDVDALASSGRAARPALPPQARDARFVRAGTDIQMEPRLGVPTFLWAAPRPAALGRRRPEEAARGHLADLAPLYGLRPDDVAGAVAGPVHDTGRGGIIASFSQEVDGVEVFRDAVKVLMDRDLGLVAISGYIPSSGPTPAQGRMPFKLGPEEAIARALGDLLATVGDVDPSGVRAAAPAAGGFDQFEISQGLASSLGAQLARPIRIKKVWFHLPSGLVPGFYLELCVESGTGPDADFYAYVVSAFDGDILFRHDLRAADSYGYRVWADAGSPFTPFDGPQGTAPSPHPTGLPDGYQAPFVAPNLVTLQNGPISTNDPWLPPGATQTVGNNVDAYVDLSSPDGLSAGDFRASTTAPNVFDRTYDTSQSPGASQNQRMAAVTQLFFVNNFLHDWFYDSGFDEASGNAQSSNYGRGGLGSDPVHAEAQDYSGLNNANMATPSDGGSPTMQMYVFSGNGLRWVQVTAPASIAGQYAAGTAAFGPAGFSLSGAVILVNDGVGTASDGCETPFTNAAAVAGRIAFIDRGVCSFATKVLNAQNNGAIGVIIANNVATGVLNMSGTGAISIPSLFISQADGNTIRAQFGAGVTATLYRELVPDRDGTIDDQVVAHEWGHYISNRLVGNAAGLSTNMAGGLGEGWGDFHAILLTVRPEDALAPANADFNGVYGMVNYVTSGGGNNGYYFGIRRLPYSTDFTKNALTFKHISNGVPLPSGVPTNGATDGSNNAEVHNTGEIWATMLWECYAALLRDTLGASPRLTFAQAQGRMKDYLVAGYKMTPNSPTLLEARDAILAAAFANDPADYTLLWQAFARRGAGVGAVAPDRYSTTNQGVVESFTAGGDLILAGATMDDSLSTQCLPDGDLDNGETGRLTFTLRNDGAVSLSATTATVTSGNPAISFPAGNAMSFPSSQPFGTTVASLPVSLAGVAGIASLDLTLSYNDPGFAVAGPRTAPVSFRCNADDNPGQSAADDVESDHPVWSAQGNPALDVSGPWHRIAVTSLDHRWLGPDPGGASDQYLVSPILNVASTGTFGFTFQHRYSFEFSGTTRLDGGVIEISTNNGASWTDIGASASPTYGGVLATGGGNPIGGRSAYSAVSPSYPAFQPVSVSLGTAYAGQNVRIRFRIGADAVVGAPGWEIDNLAFSNITNTPFPVLVPHAGPCDADSDGFVDAADCAPSNPAVWSIPGEALDLDLSGAPSTALTWAAPASAGGVASPLYDVLRSTSPSSFLAASCLESNGADLAASDPQTPGIIFYYLVRSENACGGNLGAGSNGIPRTGVSCP